MTIKVGAVALVMSLLSSPSFAETGPDTYTLGEVIAFGLKNSGSIRSARADVEIEATNLRSAEADRLPRLELSSGVTRFKYPTPITPIYGSPPANLHFPEFDTTIYDAGLSFSLPLYRGGRLGRAVTIAEVKRSIAEDIYRMNVSELVYNLTSTFYKILQLGKFLKANEETVKQLETHRKNVELALNAGTVAKVELLKTETELAHASQSELIAKNNLESAYELLKTLMGVEDMDRKIILVEEVGTDDACPPLADSAAAAVRYRPDYQAALKKVRVSEERLARARGRSLPSINLMSEYSEKSGTDRDFEENWTLGLRLSMPIFEGGAISADVGRAMAELEKAREEERMLRLSITREVRDAYLSIENAGKRIEVAERAILSAKENERIEQLRYKTGAGTSTDVIDAQTVLLRAETDYYQALFDRAIAFAALRKAVGEEHTFKGEAR